MMKFSRAGHFVNPANIHPGSLVIHENSFAKNFLAVEGNDLQLRPAVNLSVIFVKESKVFRGPGVEGSGIIQKYIKGQLLNCDFDRATSTLSMAYRKENLQAQMWKTSLSFQSRGMTPAESKYFTLYRSYFVISYEFAFSEQTFLEEHMPPSEAAAKTPTRTTTRRSAAATPSSKSPGASKSSFNDRLVSHPYAYDCTLRTCALLFVYSSLMILSVPILDARLTRFKMNMGDLSRLPAILPAYSREVPEGCLALVAYTSNIYTKTRDGDSTDCISLNLKWVVVLAQ